MSGYGSFSSGRHAGRRVGVRVGAEVLDLTGAAARLLPRRAALFADGTLDALLAAGPAVWGEVAQAVAGWVERGSEHLLPLADVGLHLPYTVADYVDFYSSEHHATLAGQLMRPGSDPLPANWKHLPVGYHGRAGTVVVSGTAIHRPSGQLAVGGEVAFGPTARLDLEAEVGFVVGVPANAPVPKKQFAEHVFGVCLVNDWSARDIQGWESIPLGPFLGKSFATSVSPWVVPLADLEAARLPPPPRDVALLPYLDDTGDPPWGLDLTLSVRINGHEVSRPPARTTYWTAAQQLAHLTVNGAILRTGDLYASGTVSGPAPDERGCLLELTRAGTVPLLLPDGATRAWLEDGDEVVITATAPGRGGSLVDLGEVRGRVLPVR